MVVVTPFYKPFFFLFEQHLQQLIVGASAYAYYEAEECRFHETCIPHAIKNLPLPEIPM